LIYLKSPPYVRDDDRCTAAVLDKFLEESPLIIGGVDAVAEVKIIPQPLYVIGMVRNRDRPFLKDSRILFRNIG
jgi:hypothetical protein